MEDHRAVSNLLQNDMYMATVDLKDAYFHVPIHVDFRKYLKFQFDGILYEFNCLAFGISSAPLTFTKILKPVFEKLRGEGNLSVRYLDDFLLLGLTSENCKYNIDATIKLIKSLGFTMGSKSVLNPSQKIKFLGMFFDSCLMQILLTGEKRAKIKKSILSLKSKHSISIREAAELEGLLISACPAVLYGLLYTRYLAIEIQQNLNLNNGNYESIMTLNNLTLMDLDWWLENIDSTFMPIQDDSFQKTIFTDASPSGWGCSMGSLETRGFWTIDQKVLHINILELLAVEKALHCFSHDDNSIRILFRVDNTTAIAYINRMGGCHQPELHCIARRIWQFCESRKLYIFASYITSKENYIADFQSRAEIDDSDWKLNPLLFSKICKVFGQPEIDLFASSETKQCTKFISWFPSPGAEGVDAFTISWNFKLAYAFPPFCLIPRVLKKLRQSKCKCIVVVPLWPSQLWYPEFNRLRQSDLIQFDPCKNMLISPFVSSPHPLYKSLKLVAAVLSQNSL